MKNGIVIPCYNESERLAFSKFQRFLIQRFNYTLCFVNDGSKDNTLQKLLEFRKGQEHRVHVYDMPQNGGKAEAVRAGINYLLEETDVTSVGFLDADLATGFDDYRSLVIELSDPLDQKSMVFGSRKLDESTEIERNLFRKLASEGIGKMIQWMVGLPIKDTQCGAKVFSREAAQFAFNKSFISRWLFDVEIFIRMRKRYGKKQSMQYLTEKALNSWEEVDGSKITLKDSLKFPQQLLKIAVNYNVKPLVHARVKNVQRFSMAVARSLFL